MKKKVLKRLPIGTEVEVRAEKNLACGLKGVIVDRARDLCLGRILIVLVLGVKIRVRRAEVQPLHLSNTY